MSKFSTGLRNAMLSGTGLKANLDLGFLKVYAGAVPADADASLGGATLLNTYSNNDAGTGLHFAAASASGVLTKLLAEVWKGTAVASGAATFARFVAAADTGASSTSEARIQLSVGVTGADLNLTAGTTLASGTAYTLDSFAVEVPTN